MPRLWQYLLSLEAKSDGFALSRCDLSPALFLQPMDWPSRERPTLNRFDLSGRTALITGASRGIGFALAEGLAGAGARVILNGRSLSSLEEAAQRLSKYGAQVNESMFDVTDAAQAAAAI